MRSFILLTLLAAISVLAHGNGKSRGPAGSSQLRIGVKYKPTDCPIKSRPGDHLSMHYDGQLEDGTPFDSSRDRGQPFDFTLGTKQVIPGWDQGLVDMCIGEKRKLKIPPHLAYGDDESGPIPPDSTLIFEVELLDILNRKADTGKADL
ncbi:hypothetical protein P389DRAFT_14503 [Cystobasidium minutum MCA 4210]|uniref:uncharacterized protein n=1 Tax=Cystobasidium minutum MCA 4210 TaxID=1397322 RepID=UPI0034CE7BA5|eukprot:jgi/Rhomi1/14503/CE14502_30464